MPGQTRKGVDFSAGHCFEPRPPDQGSPDVIVNGNPAVRIDDHYPTHTCGNKSHDGNASAGSPTVIINGKGSHRIGDDINCGDVSAGGSPNVMVGDQSFSITAVADNAMHNGDDIDDGTTAGATASHAYVQSYIDKGVFTATEIAAPAVATAADNTPPVAAGPVTGDCNIINTTQVFPDSFDLAAPYTLGDITKRVTFPHQVVANKGLSVQTIVCNLKMLTINCWTPIKAQYPNAFITCSFRPGAQEKQHGDGNAMDIQFRNSLKSDYFTIAQWIKDNVQFDRLLLEYKTTGSGLPWIHISFNSAGLNKLVFTFLNDRKYSTGLVDLSSSQPR